MPEEIMSKYTPLSEHLQRLSADATNLSFSEVEKIIGCALPHSARTHQAWWANSRTNDTHVWAHEWLDAGWEKHELDLSRENVSFRRQQVFELDSRPAIEGYVIDRKILQKSRNRSLAERRRVIDNYTCKACDFLLKVGSRYVIDVHHIDPLSASEEKETTLEDLVTLCPTCHRIAHMRSTPYTVQEIQGIRQSNGISI
jgi:predicted HNH restriction endonuclease